MSTSLKKTISAALVLMLLACCIAPLSAMASSPMYFVDTYTEGGGYIVRQKAMYAPGEIVLVRAIPEEGFAFFCWQSDDVLLESYTSDLTRFIMPESDVRVSAVFAIVQDSDNSTVNVTFDTMGGSAFNGVDVIVGECVAKPENVPTKEGYVFDGWFADAQCTLPFDFSSPITAATFIYAKWAEVQQETTETNEFSDVKSSDWFFEHVMSLAEKNIISGMGKDSNGKAYFAPQSNITRAQFITILLNMSEENLYKDTDISKVFDDVSNSDWYADAVAWAYSTGVASGTGEKQFSPNKYITRQDMAVMISNYVSKVAKKTLPDSVARIEFPDSYEIADYAKASVEAMQRAGIISGKRNNHGSIFFDPRAFATRAETSKMIDVLLSML